MKKCATNVIMLTEEQIQKLAKKLADEHGDDEEECKKYVRFMANSSEKLHAFLPEGKKELFKKNPRRRILRRSHSKSFYYRTTDQ